MATPGNNGGVTTKITWPIVALVALGVGAFVGIFALIPDDEPTGRSALLALLVLGGNAVVVVFQQRNTSGMREELAAARSQLARVQTTVNGNTARLIDTNAELSRRLTDGATPPTTEGNP